MSATTPGNFDCTNLLEIKVMADRIFKDDVRRQEYVAEVDSIKMIREIQTADLSILENPTKDVEMKVTWVDDCDDTEPTDCSDECQVAGNEAGSQCKDYTMDECFEVDFYVTEKQFRTQTISKEEVVAKQLLKKMKLMDEEWTRRAIAFLVASRGTNKNEEPYTVSGGVTSIPAAAFNPDLFGYLYTTMRLNRLPSARLLTGRLLDQYMWKAQVEATTPDGASQKAKMGFLGNIYQDLFMLDSEVGSKAMFLVNPNSVAHASKNYFSNTPREVYPSGGGKQWQYKMRSQNIPGLEYDVIHQEICEGNDIKESWRLKSKGGLYLNPTGCDTGITGVLQFGCAA